MKAVFAIFLVAFFVLIPGYQATSCAEFRGCVTHDKENATKSENPIHCENNECSAWGCTIDGVLYGGSGCKGDENICTGQKGAIVISCKDDPTCAINKLIESRSQNIDRSNLISGSCDPHASILKSADAHFETGHFRKSEACAKSCISGQGRCGTFSLPGGFVHSDDSCDHGDHCYCNL